MSDLFTAFTNMAEADPDFMESNDPILVKMRETLDTFLKTCGYYIHELGWCKDPFCSIKNKKQK